MLKQTALFITQFKKPVDWVSNNKHCIFQGVDLSSIMKDICLGGGDGRLVSITVSNLKELSNYDDEEILKQLGILKVRLDSFLLY